MAKSIRLRIKHRFAAIICSIFGLACASACCQTIRIIVGGIEKQIYLPAPLAQRLGYFAEQRLDVRLLTDTSGVHAEDELLAGAAQGVVGFYDHTIGLQAKGKYVQCVVQFSQSPGEAEIVASRLAEQIQSPRDFKGHTLGVTGLGSSTDVLTRYLASVGGIRSDEMRLLSSGSGADFVSALLNGRIDGGMTTEPTVSSLIKRGGARMLVDLRTPQSAGKVLGGVYPGACLYMASLWVSTHRLQVQGLVNAFVKALHYIDEHSAEEIAAELPPEYFLGNTALYIEALRDSKVMFLADGKMPPSGPAVVLNVLRRVDRGVRSKPIDLARTYTDEFTSLSP